eukprot:scaffold132207_cov63-Phaeocystis_antarctica.AAC.4
MVEFLPEPDRYGFTRQVDREARSASASAHGARSSRVEQALPLCHLCAARTAAHAQHLSSLRSPTRGAAGREHALSAVGTAAHVALVLRRVRGVVVRLGARATTAAAAAAAALLLQLLPSPLLLLLRPAARVPAPGCRPRRRRGS